MTSVWFIDARDDPRRKGLRDGYTNRKDWQAITPALRAIYTAATVDEAGARFGEFAEAWGVKYPAVIKVWTDAWERFTPFLAYGACRRMRVVLGRLDRADCPTIH